MEKKDDPWKRGSINYPRENGHKLKPIKTRTNPQHEFHISDFHVRVADLGAWAAKTIASCEAV